MAEAIGTIPVLRHFVNNTIFHGICGGLKVYFPIFYQYSVMEIGQSLYSRNEMDMLFVKALAFI